MAFSEGRRNSSQCQQFLHKMQALLGDINQQRLSLHVWYNCIDVAMWGTLKDNLSDNNPHNDDMNDDIQKICFQYHHNNLSVQ
jgi:hypothetical protein